MEWTEALILQRKAQSTAQRLAQKSVRLEASLYFKFFSKVKGRLVHTEKISKKQKLISRTKKQPNEVRKRSIGECYNALCYDRKIEAILSREAQFRKEQEKLHRAEMQRDSEWIRSWIRQDTIRRNYVQDTSRAYPEELEVFEQDNELEYEHDHHLHNVHSPTRAARNPAQRPRVVPPERSSRRFKHRYSLRLQQTATHVTYVPDSPIRYGSDYRTRPRK